MNAAASLSLFLVVASSIAHSQLASMKRIARFLVLQTWEGRFDQVLASRGAETGASPSWRAGDPQWEAVKSKWVSLFGKGVDDLLQAPDAEQIVTKRFTEILTDENADAAAAKLKGPLGAGLINWSDNLAVNLAVMDEKGPNFNFSDPATLDEIKRWQQKAGVHPPPRHDAALDAARIDKAVKQYLDARSSAVTFLVIGVDGQLKLLFFDHQEEFFRDADAAIARSVKAHAK